MWHKVSPISFRIPYILNWSSAWYSDKKTYASDLWLDVKLRDSLKKQLSGIPVWDINVNRNDDHFVVNIYTSKTALVLGKDNENLDNIEKTLSKLVKKTVKVNVKEIKRPDINSKIVWYQLKNQIEKRMPYKRAIKQAISRAMEKWAKWIKIKVGWRLNWAEIARKETFKDWNVPTQTIRADLDYCSTRAETVYWTIWLKIWIFKWEIFKKK